MFWLLGNLSGVRWADVWMAVSAAVGGCLTCFWHIRALDAFTFGIDSAASLGIAVRRVQVLLIGAAALTTAVMVSIVGSIGFVGLVIQSEEHTSELQSLMRLSYAVFCLKKKKTKTKNITNTTYNPTRSI